MAQLPAPLGALIEALNQLPGVGPRSAERIALHIVQSDAQGARQLSKAILEARERITNCERCGALTESQPCSICSDTRRETTLICLVERAVDILSIEKSGAFKGRYHVLGGKISPVNGVAPEDLKIDSLECRVKSEGIKEIVLALGTDVEGDATSYYLAKRLEPAGIIVSRIAHGLPAGSGLEFADELTLTHALQGRRPLAR